MPTPLEGVVLDMEVFRVVRANQDRRHAFIKKELQEHLPDNTPESIDAALKRLYERMTD